MKSSKKALAFALAAAMVVTAFPVTNAEAASTAKLNKKSVTVAAGTAAKQTKSIKVTTPSTWKSVKVKVSSSNKKIATVKASGKTVKVTAVKKGSAKVTVKVTAKKAGKAVSKTLKANVKVVNAGLKFTSDAAEVNTGATLALSVKKVPSVAKITYTSSDTAVATVSEDGVVTGVKAGKVTITAESDYGKKVEKEITVVDTVAKLATVKQTASNAFIATFTADASKVTKDDVKVAATDGSSELAVKSVELSADKLSANVTVYNSFADGKEYTVTCNDSTQAFTASVGEVTNVTVKTTEAQLNVKTPISFVLTDANGIDVTPAVDLKAKCNITVEGNYSTAEIGDASEAYITMTNEGDVAKVTVSYDNGAKDFTPVAGSGEIKCVKAEAVKANALFTTSTDKNTNSQCAKFYLGLSDKSVAVEEGGAAKDVYFCAKDETGKVVSYDKYEVQSSNEDCVTATVSTDNGKYAVLSVSGNTVGSASLTVTTSKNGAVKTFVIPVTVTKKDVAVKMTVDVSRRTMSNAVDYEYNAKVSAQLFDAAGNKVDGNYTYEITNNSVKSPASISATGVFTANNAAAQTYTVKVSGSDNKTSTVFTRNVSITVQSLSAKAKLSAGVAMTYAVEIDKKALDPNKNDARTTTAKLYATCNGVFAGYVREDGKIGAATAGGAATAFADDNTKLTSVKYLAKYGTLKFSDGELVKSNSDAYNTAKASTYTGAATFKCVKGTNVTYKANDFDTIAKNGTYTVEFRLVYDSDKKNTSKDEDGNAYAAVTNTFTVNNTVVVPTVTVDTRKVDLADYVAGLSTDVDMNNNTSSHESITADNSADNEKPSTDGTKLTVKNVKVTDTRAGLNWTFYVPINTTFTQK